MDWPQRLNLLVVDHNLRVKATLKLLHATTEFWTALVDYDNDAVQATLLALIGSPVADMFSNFALCL
jgi:hypothetical protein